MISAILTLAATALGLFAWWVKRKQAPTPEDRKADNRQQFQDTFKNVYTLRTQGNHAEADAMLGRLATSATSQLVRDVAKSSISNADTDRKRMGDIAPKGEPGVHYPRSDDSASGSGSQRDEG